MNICPMIGEGHSERRDLREPPRAYPWQSRDICETMFDDDVQTDSSANQCPECDGRVTNNTSVTVCEVCGLVVDKQRIDHGPE